MLDDINDCTELETLQKLVEIRGKTVIRRQQTQPIEPLKVDNEEQRGGFEIFDNTEEPKNEGGKTDCLADLIKVHSNLSLFYREWNVFLNVYWNSVVLDWIAIKSQLLEKPVLRMCLGRKARRYQLILVGKLDCNALASDGLLDVLDQ